MGLEEIIADIDANTKAKVASVLDGAGREAQKIREDAQKDANLHIENTKRKAQGDAARLIAREFSRANIESRKIYQDAVTATIDGALDSLSGSLQEYVKSTDYARFLNKSADLAAKELGEDCTIYAQKADLPKIKHGGAAEAKDQFSGGIKAVSSDGKRSVDFTLESVFQNLKEDIAVQLLKTLSTPGKQQQQPQQQQHRNKGRDLDG